MTTWAHRLVRGFIGESASDINVSRFQRARATTLALISNRIINLGAKLLMVPLSLSILGREEYGAWLVLLSLSVWLAQADLGSLSALINPLSAAIATHNHRQARVLISTSAISLGALGLALTVIALALLFLIPAEHILGLHGRTHHVDVTMAITVVVLLNLTTLPTRLPEVMLAAMQRGYWTAFSDSIAQIGVMCALIALRMTGGSLTTFALAINTPTLVADCALWIFAARTFGKHLVPALHAWSSITLRDQIHDSMAFFAGAWGELLVMQTPNIVIAQMLGASSVPLYAVPYQLFFSLYAALNMLATPFWPAWAHAASTRDQEFIRRTFRKILAESTVLAGCGFAVLALVSPWFIGAWAGKQYAPDWTLCLLFFCQFVQWSWNYVFVVLLTALGFIWVRVRITLALGLLNVILCVVLTHWLGIRGIVGGLLLAMVMTQTWYLPTFAYIKAPWLFHQIARPVSTSPETHREVVDGL